MVDGAFLYLGSANWTGAGLGAKGAGRRNFELGFVTADDQLLDRVQFIYERIWSGGECGACKMRDLCPGPLDIARRFSSGGVASVVTCALAPRDYASNRKRSGNVCTKTRETSDSILALIKETADGFGHLLADHIKLARLELVADVKSYGRQVALIALIVPILFIGYAIAVPRAWRRCWRRWLGHAGGLFLVGGAHIVIGAIAITVAVGRLRRAQPMSETVEEMSRSMETFAPARVGNGAPARRRRLIPSSSPRG